MRLEGIKKAGFYALPPITTSLIAGLLHPAHPSNDITILDSCAGNGIPARSFAQALLAKRAKSVTTYGVELSPDRANQARGLLDYVINDDWYNIQTSNDAYSMIYLNPPYDWEGQREDDERQERQEYLFLKSNMSKLALRGLLVYVIPRQTLAEVKLQRFLAGHLDALTVYSFPADEYEQFRQLVIFGYRRKLDRHPDIKDNLAMLERFAKDELPPELTADCPAWEVIPTGKSVDEIAFYQFSLSRDQLLDIVREHGMYSREEWREQRKIKEMEDFRPAVPMRPGHLSMLLLSGVLRTMSLNNGELLVKGRVEKREEQTFADEDEQIYQEMFYTKLFVLHADGRHEVIDTEEAFQAFMQTYSPEMARILETRFKPLYTSPTQEEWDKLAPLLQTKRLPGRVEAGLLDAQKHMIIASSRVIKKHKTATIVAEMGFGKAQPLSARLATPSGWITMGEVKVGDLVIGANGKPTRVTGVYPQGIRPVYTLTFSDGTTVEADADHLWQVNTATRLHREHEWIIKTTQELFDEGSIYTHGGSKYRIPVCQPVEYSMQPNLPIDPYLLGLLLGDGTLQSSAVGFTTADEELLASVRQLAPVTINLWQERSNPYNYRLTTKPGQSNPLLIQIRQLGLAGKTSYYKFIPESYKRASIADRIAILQGLCDTDGAVGPGGGHVEFSTSSEQLAQDLQEVVESLGGTARITARIPSYTHKGERLTGAVAYRLHINLPATVQPFRLQRKQNGYHGGATLRTQPKRLIRKIEFKGYEATQCIRVDAPDHLYLTNHFVVTHNTATAASVAHLLNAYPAIVIGPAHMPEKWAEELQDTVPDISPVIVTSIVEMRGVYEEYERKRSVGEPLPKLVVILSLQDGKNGSGWRTATHPHHRYIKQKLADGERRIIKSTSPTCAHCAKIPTDDEGYPYYTKIPDDKKMDCPHCGKPLWQYYHRFNSELQRWPVAKWIRTQLPRGWFKLLIADEVHDYKSRDTDQGQAYTDLVQACKYNLNLTGTWFGGKSKDIFYLLYRTNPQVRAEFAFGAESQWSERFGRLQRTVKSVKEMKDGAFTGKTRYYTSTRELPGINPGIVPYILPTILFASIKDLGYELPGYVEEIVRIDMTPEQKSEYDAYSDDLMEKAREGTGRDKARYISVWQQTCLGRPDSIYREDKIHILNEEGEIEKKEGRTVKRYKLFRTLPPLIDGDVLSPKEQWLLETVQDEIAQGRKALIYLRQTGTRDIQPRLMDILRRHGYRPVLIPDKIKPKDRAKWIKNIVPEADCLIVNPRKVATGLDLVQFATAIVYEIDYSLVVLWQAIRRIWRLGQIKNVKVLFAVYRDTLEEAALTLMGQKMRAAYNIYGSAATSALADEAGGDNIIDQITRQILVHGKIQTNGFTGLVQQEAATVSTWNKTTSTNQNLMRPPTISKDSPTILDGEYEVDDTPLETPTPETPAFDPPVSKPKRTLQPKRTEEGISFFAMRQQIGSPGKAKGKSKKQEVDEELQLALF